MLITAIIITGVLVTLLSNRFRPDSVALIACLALYIVGILDSQQVVTGFSSPTTLLIAGLLAMSAALKSSGFTDWLGASLSHKKGNPRDLIGVVMLFTALSSSVMSNTAVVAMLLPVSISLCRTRKISAKRVLLPVAFAANLGGLLTSIGTPANIIVNQTLVKSGMRGFSFFEYSLIGAPLAFLTIAYFYFFPMSGDANPPEESREGGFPAVPSLIETYSLHERVCKVEVLHHGECDGKSLSSAALGARYDIEVLDVKRGSQSWRLPGGNHLMQGGDVMLIRWSGRDLSEVVDELGLSVCQFQESTELANEILEDGVELYEVIIPP